MEFTQEYCIRLMPEWNGLDLVIGELKGGITNALFRVRAGDQADCVFRFYGKKTELFIDRNVEMENLRRLAPLGITPRVIKYLPGQGVTVVEFIPGYVLKNPDFLREDLWEKIASTVRTIHRSGVDLPRLFDPLIEVKRLNKILAEIQPNYPEFDIQKTMNILDKIDAIAELPPSQYVPCHNDLLADNFILTGEETRVGAPLSLIDWEYGGMAPAYYDLADMFQEILLPEEVEKRLLALYWQDSRTDHHQYMTDLYKPFPDIYWFLWSLIQRSISAIEFDYYLYGKVKYENAWKNIDRLRNHYGVPV